RNLTERQLGSNKLGIAGSDGTLGTSTASGKSAWVQKQVDLVLPEIFRQISGRNGNVDDFIRTEGIRAGGTQEGNTFLVNQSQLDALKANPYLTVESKPAANGKDFFVSYHY